MATTLAELASLVGGEVRGDSATTLSGAATLAEAEAGEITLIDRADKAAQLAQSAAAAAVAPQGAEFAGRPLLLVADVHAAFTAVVRHFRPQRTAAPVGVSAAASVSASARIGANVNIYPGATIGEEVEIGPDATIHAGCQIMAGSKLGAGVTLMPNVVLYENTIVGDRVLIHAGAVLGAYGFGYHFVAGRHQLSAQLGNVVIGDDVEIGANTTIDRGAYGATKIGDGTKIDNLVMIAHNCQIGRHNLICSQVGIAGSTSTGDYVVMAGQVGVRDHVHIGHRAVLGAMAGVVNNVPEDTRMIGVPATPERDQKLLQASLSKLPEMRKQLKAMQRTIDELQTQNGASKPSAAA